MVHMKGGREELNCASDTRNFSLVSLLQHFRKERWSGDLCSYQHSCRVSVPFGPPADTLLLSVCRWVCVGLPSEPQCQTLGRCSPSSSCCSAGCALAATSCPRTAMQTGITGIALQEGNLACKMGDWQIIATKLCKTAPCRT